ncbi:MAG TPA: patatin-like phospholipase family protein [Acidimicrobiales bacterium]|nr:patatin-like phospholipase family protein [Acidimicrobiales bacterium]
MTTAFVLSGGASLGSVQVGMLLALAERGERPDMIVGTSVGAINGAWIASRPDFVGVQGLADLWSSLKSRDVFPRQLGQGLLGFVGRRQSLVSAAGLRRLISAHLDFERLEDAPIPLHVVATDLLTGKDARLSTGNALEAITASASIPSVFPPVMIDGKALIDGGVVNNTPIADAVALGADVVWVLPTGYACSLDKPPRGALSIALHALTLTINQRLAVDVARYESSVDLRLIPPLCPIATTPLDFSHTRELIDASYAWTNKWLDGKHPWAGQAKLLALHEH